MTKEEYAEQAARKGYIQREREFLQELAELTRRYGIIIGGSGDLGSPWLMDDKTAFEPGATYAVGSNGNNLEWQETE